MAVKAIPAHQRAINYAPKTVVAAPQGIGSAGGAK